MGHYFPSFHTMPPIKVKLPFFSSMLTFLAPHLEGKVIMGGDSNMAFDHLLDKSTQNKSQLKRPPNQSLQIARLFHSLGMIDSWRELHPSSTDYTHFFAPHRTYARIDHIFLHSSDIHLASQASICEVPWSDHSLVSIKITGFLHHTRPPQWRFNETLLTNPVHSTMIERDLKEYFWLNDTPDISPISLWGAHKLVIRGNLIQLASCLKREKQLDIANLEKNFQSLSKAHENNPSPTSLGLLDAAKIALNSALTSSVENT